MFIQSRILILATLGLSLLLLILSAIGVFIGNNYILLPPLLLSCALLCLSTLSFLKEREIDSAIKKSANKISLPITKSEATTSILNRMLFEIEKMYELNFVLIPSATVGVSRRRDFIQDVFEVYQKNFPVSAIRLNLFEDESGISARKYSIGQAQWIEDEEAEFYPSDYVLKESLVFGGKVFGEILLELEDPIVNNGGDLRTLKVLSAYTSIMFMNAEFNKELGRLRQLSDETQEVKTGFLANLSHEIRGPLGVILNSVELILDGICGEIPSSADETLQMVKDSTHHLMDLVNDVLDFAKIESGNIDANPHEVLLFELLDDMATVLRSQAIKKNQKLIVERPDERIAIICDRRHGRQMLINLLTNAIKYTPEGGGIKVYAERTSATKVKIIVEDTGVGIAESEFFKVFGAFQRTDDEYSRTQQGTGLGMPLTKKLVEANKGDIGFSSEVGVGSTFWIELPCKNVQPLKTEEHDGSIISLGNGENILLLEPDDEQRSLFGRSLNQRGFSVTSVSSASEVLREFRSKHYSAVLIETDLVDLRAEELIQSLRSLPQGVKVPLVVMTGKAFSFDVERFLKLGVDRCLSKPFSLVDLAATLRRLLDQSEQLNDL